MIIKNKMESLAYIQKLKLNQLPEIYLNGFNEEKIISFLHKYKAQIYAIRDKTISMSPKHANVHLNEVVEYCKFSGLEKFTINVSSRNYPENQVLCGEICIYEDERIDYILSKIPSHTVRDCLREPTYNGTTFLSDRKLKNIEGLHEIINYIFINNLLNIIVEFTVFNCPVGINQEKVAIWELRTSY